MAEGTGLTPEATLGALLAEVRAVAAATPHFDAFAGGLLDGEMPLRPVPPRRLPALGRLPDYPALAGPTTEALARAVVAAVPHLSWRQSYTEREVGARFLAGYAWTNLISPEGPFVSPDCRLSIGTWEAGLVYPEHAHAPEEIYLVVAGGAVFGCEGRAERRLGPGETWVNPPRAVHWARMEGAPLLAMALWKGEALTRNPDLSPAVSS